MCGGDDNDAADQEGQDQRYPLLCEIDSFAAFEVAQRAYRLNGDGKIFGDIVTRNRQRKLVIATFRQTLCHLQKKTGDLFRRSGSTKNAQLRLQARYRLERYLANISCNFGIRVCERFDLPARIDGHPCRVRNGLR
jgi:hypothetical protein